MKMIKRGIAFCLVIMLLMGIAFDNGFAIMDQVKAADEVVENTETEGTAQPETEAVEDTAENTDAVAETTEEYTTEDLTAESYALEEPAMQEMSTDETVTETPASETQTADGTVTEEPAAEESTQTEQMPETKKQDAMELKQEVRDQDGNVVMTVVANIAEDTFDANTSEVSMKVSEVDASLTKTITELAKERLAADKELGSYFLYKVEFQVNGTTVEPGKEVELIFQPTDYKVDDVKKANVFYYNEAYSTAGNQEEEIVEIIQKADQIEELQNAGASIENIDEEYDLTEITLHNNGNADKIITEGRRSTVYGCYLEEQKPEEVTGGTTEETQAEEKLKTLTYKNSDVTINVSEVAKGAIPKNAKLKVVPIEKDDKATKEQYAEVEKQVQEKIEKEKKELGGFLAYDISFIDADGNKVEPNSEVKVTIEYNNAAKPNVEKNKEKQSAEVSVLHLEEDKKGNVKEVVDMDAAGQLDVLKTTDNDEVQKVEVRTESFSTFTITWTYGGMRWDKLTVTAYYVYTDENGQLVEIPENEMNGKKPENITIDTSGQTIDLTDKKYQIEIPGYTYQDTTINGNSVTALYSDTEQRTGLLTSWDAHLIKYKIAGQSSYTEWLDSDKTKTGNIYFVYKKIVPNKIKIQDHIVQDGTLYANFIPNDDQITATQYTWFRADTENGTYEEVEQIHYQGGKSNISEDGQFLYPAYDKGARKWYKVKATLSDGTTVESEPFQVPYYDELKNGSFEDVRTSMYSTFFSNKNYASQGGVWQSTGVSPVGKEIEIASQEYQDQQGNYKWYGDWSKSAADGSQFAELNADKPGALYQDVLTMEGTPLNYSLQHRARGDVKSNTPEYDTMYLVMMPTAEAEKNNLTTQEQLNTYLRNKGIEIDQNYQEIGSDLAYDKDGIRIIRITSDDQNWQRFSGTSYIPTASLTRFFFVAGYTASKDGTVGNFLDDVGFSQKLPDVSNEEFTLQITKNFAGLDNATMQAIQDQIKFVISVKEGETTLTDEEIIKLFGKKEITKADMKETASGSLIYILGNQKITTDNQYEVTITEQQANADGYSLTAESVALIRRGDVSSTEINGTDSITFDLQGKTIAEVTFNNEYLRSENKIINFTKVWDDGENEFQTRPDRLDVTLVPTIEVVEDGVLREITLTADDLGIELVKTLNQTGGWKTSWEVPVYYNYNDAKVLIHYTVTEGAIESEYVYESTSESALEGNGSEYHKVFDSTSIVRTPTTKARAARVSMKANRVSNTNAESGEATELGAPVHNKYVEYNKADGSYTLKLDVTGATGETTGVDVLFVIDTSGSMSDGGLLKNVQNLLTKGEDGVIDQIFKTEGNVNSVAYVSFAGVDETRVSDWYNSTNKENLENSINRLRATGGTNWTYAMEKASELLAKRADSKNEKVVIFLSDGEPTYTMKDEESWWGGTQHVESGSGSSTKSTYYDDAANVVNTSSSLKTSKFYSVYLNNATESGMQKFDDKLTIKHHEVKNGEDLSTALNDILQVIIPAYENVVITDTLSQYVDFVDGGVITVTKQSADGSVITLTQDTDYRLTRDGKHIQVEFVGKLDDGAKYTVSTTIKPNDAANTYYTTHNGYPGGAIGEVGTGVTSEGKEGFYSNEANSAKVTYTVNNKQGESAYPMPVVQVLDHTLTFEKKWNKPVSVNVPNTSIDIKVTYTDGTSENLQLTAENNWTLSKQVPITKQIGTVEEITKVPDYEPSYQISTDRKSAIITNNYAKITTQTIEVQKEWIGENAPKSDIKVALYQSKNGGEPNKFEEKTLSENNRWKCTWKVPLTDSEGAEEIHYSYAVREENIPAGYNSSISYDYQNDKTVVTITNTYDSNCASENYYIVNVLQTDKITVDKKWEDNNDALKLRPESLDISVNNGQGDIYEFTLGRDNWHKELTVLEKKNAVYSATESGLNENYEQESCTVTQTGNGAEISFVNKITSKSIVVKKVWHDNEVPDRPTGIQFKIEYRESGTVDWKPYGTFNLLKDDLLYNETGEVIEKWAKEITNLRADCEYRVVETVEGCGNYTSIVKETTDELSRQVFTIENTLNWSLVKTNLPGEGQTAINLSGAKFTLTDSENKQVATGTSGDDGVVAWTWQTGTDPTNLSGTYTLKEIESPTGYQLLDTEWILNFENGLLKSVGNDAKYNEYISTSQTAAEGFVITLKNDVIYELPQSGGTGIYWYLFGGVLLMMAASLIVYKKRRREVLERR